LVAPVYGRAAAESLIDRLWAIDRLDEVSTLVEALAKPAR
jgi:hypothetical protein